MEEMMILLYLISFRGEYTFGENGFTPLCSSKELNGYYKDNNLEYIIKQPRY